MAVDRQQEMAKIKESMLEQMRDLASVTAVVLSAIEDAQPTEEQRRAVVPQYLEALKDVMAMIRMAEAEFGNQARGEAVPPKYKLN